MRCDEFSTSRQIERFVGLDNSVGALNFCREHGIYDELVQWDLGESPLPFRNKEFDVAIASDVIEHLPPKQADNLIAEVERISDLSVLTLSTVPEDEDEHRLRNHHSMDSPGLWLHQSHFSPKKLKRMGYRVRGLQRSRHFMSSRASHILENPFWIVPSLSARILCRKGSIGHKVTQTLENPPLQVN